MAIVPDMAEDHAVTCMACLGHPLFSEDRVSPGAIIRIHGINHQIGGKKVSGTQAGYFTLCAYNNDGRLLR